MSAKPSLMNYVSAQVTPQDGPPPALKRKSPKRKGTEEIIQTSFRLTRSQWRKLHELALDERASVQALIVHALEQEFARRG
ncbi:MAG: hypothetical protein ACP5NM_12355, partial [Thiomonas sp.]